MFTSTRHHTELVTALLAAQGISCACVYGAMDQVTALLMAVDLLLFLPTACCAPAASAVGLTVDRPVAPAGKLAAVLAWTAAAAAVSLKPAGAARG